MRILHLADLHLGKIFHDVHLTDDQAYLLDQAATLAKDEHVDTVVISGDVYNQPPDQRVHQFVEEFCG